MDVLTPMSVHTSFLGPRDIEDQDMPSTRRAPLCTSLEDAPTVSSLPSDGSYEDMPETKRR